MEDFIDDKTHANSGIAKVSERGVIFLRNQDASTEQMRAFIEKLTSLAGRVSTSPLSFEVIGAHKQVLAARYCWD